MNGLEIMQSTARLVTLKNKLIVISAGASGIGWAAAKLLQSRGAKIFLCDIDKQSIEKISKNLTQFLIQSSRQYTVTVFRKLL